MVCFYKLTNDNAKTAHLYMCLSLIRHKFSLEHLKNEWLEQNENDKGAGYHSKEKEKEYKLACSMACKRAMRTLKNHGSAVDAVSIAIQSLEDSVVTNAGVGSSLSIDGTVECDASIMDGQTLLFGGVGALMNIQNPISVARKLVEEQKQGTLALGRIAPCLMVGGGATNWAKQHGIQTVSSDNMKTGVSVKTYENHKRRLEATEERKRKKRKYLQVSVGNSVDSEECDNEDQGVQDTVGAVCIDAQGNMAAGVSSGGISLKQTGRLGPAALYGAGCWAYNWKQEDKPGVAVATSGTGEHIIKTMLGRTCGDALQRHECPLQAVQITLQEHFLDSDFLDQAKERYGGVVALKHEKTETDIQNIELLWGHTTDSMCIGYMTSEGQPKTVISRFEENGRTGYSYLLQGQHFTV